MKVLDSLPQQTCEKARRDKPSQAIIRRHGRGLGKFLSELAKKLQRLSAAIGMIGVVVGNVGFPVWSAK